MKRILIAVSVLFLAFACKDDDSRDDTILDMDNVVGKDWYYNAWMGNKEGMETPDLLEVVRLEKGGQLKSVEFGGRQETTVGTWLKDGNRLTMQYTDGETVTWDVLHSGEDYLQVLTNEGGRREYRSSLDYLGELTADAFLMNEYSEYDNQYRTYIAADVRGNIDVREGMLLLGNGGNVALENHEYYWSAQNAYEIQDLDENRNVRFYVRIGKDNHVKLSDSIYTENLAHRSPAEMDLQVNTNGSEIDVTWKPYVGQQVYYRVEIFRNDNPVNTAQPYFLSRIQPVGSTSLSITQRTAGEVNKLADLQPNQSYRLRLTALLYESGVDPVNDYYAYANLQAVAYFEKPFVWE